MTGVPHPDVPSHRIQHEKAGDQGQGQGVECCEGQIERDCLSGATLDDRVEAFFLWKAAISLTYGKAGKWWSNLC